MVDPLKLLLEQDPDADTQVAQVAAGKLGPWAGHKGWPIAGQLSCLSPAARLCLSCPDGPPLTTTPGVPWPGRVWLQVHVFPEIKLFKCTGSFYSSVCPNGQVLLISNNALHQASGGSTSARQCTAAQAALPARGACFLVSITERPRRALSWPAAAHWYSRHRARLAARLQVHIWLFLIAVAHVTLSRTLHAPATGQRLACAPQLAPQSRPGGGASINDQPNRPPCVCLQSSKSPWERCACACGAAGSARRWRRAAHCRF